MENIVGKTLNVNNIYPAFMGEVNCHGIGTPCTFVRLAGCNLRCYHSTKGTLCDTPEALEMRSGKSMPVANILENVRCYGRQVVCLTGGEPLVQNVEDLLTELSNRGYNVVVETNGSKSISPYRHIRNVSFVVDVKSSSSGEAERMLEDNYALLDKNDFVKFVIDTEEDLCELKEWLTSHDWIGCSVAVGLFWGAEVSYEHLTKSVLNMGVHLNIQTHKMAYLYDKYRGDENFSSLYFPKDI